MQINLENLEAGNVVVLRDGTKHVVESVIFTVPVQLLIAEDRERFHTVYLKFAEDPFDESHLYGLNGNFALVEDMRDIVEIREQVSEQIDLTQAKPGNTVVLRNGAHLTIDQIIYDPYHEDLEYRIHIKFVETEKPLFYRPNGLYQWGKHVEDPRDILSFSKRTTVTLSEVYEKTSFFMHNGSGQTFSIQQYDEGEGLLDLEYDDGSHYKSLPLDTLVTVAPNGNLIIDDDEFIPYQSTRIKF